MIQFNEFCSFVEGLKDEVTRITKKYYYSDVEVESKQDDSPVTKADREIEAYIRSEIEKTFSGHAIIGEEYGETGNNESLSSWTVDPIDGTYSFIHRIPLFATLISYCYDSKPVFGMIFQPISGEMVVGSEFGTFYNGEPARLRSNKGLNGATILTTSTTNIEKLHDGDKFRYLSLEAKTVRTWGDAYGYIMLVTGRADVMLDPKMKIWDVAPLIPIVKGAGGEITDFKGGDPMKGSSIVATTNKELQNYVLKKLN